MPATALGQTPAPTSSATTVPTASLSASTTKAAPGASITVNGAGFQGGETVDVAFNGTPVGQPTVGQDGTFALSFQVPNLSAGDYGITGKGRASGRNASMTFTITQGAAALSFSTMGAAPGDSITINGTGFLPGETVTVSFNGPNIGTPTADTAGDWSLPFTIPQLSPGSYGVTATGQTSNRVANANFTVILVPPPAPTPIPTAGPAPTP